MSTLSKLKILFSFSQLKGKKQLYYHPFQNKNFPKNQKDLQEAVQEIFKWGKFNGAQYYSFWAQPLNQKIAEKQQTFLQINHFKHNLISNTTGQGFKSKNILKGEGDGSSFPHGSLRATHSARAYFVWDWKSPLFINSKSKVMYIPSFLVSHSGEALDDRTIYRKAEKKINELCSELLNQFKIKNNGITTFVGLQQQFFIIHEKDYYKRIDLHQTQRAIIGQVPPHNQQFSDHYYSKLQHKIQDILRQAEQRLTEMGVPIKTRHKQVAPNQYQFCSIFQEASIAIDHIFIKQQVLQQICSENALTPIWYQKPFLDLNGSGKHLNWSLNYFDQNYDLVNLFKPGECSNKQLFWLLLFIHAKALAANQHLFLASVAVPGNELRMGGHQAPPRTLSLALGQHFNNLMNNVNPNKKNLKDQLEGLTYNITGQNEDRNRTSPYAYVSNRFEYRSVGSTQNVFFPMAIILTTLASQIQKALKQLRSGVSTSDLINRLRSQTENIRFDGDGYSQEWKIEAQKRNLYTNVHFSENFENLQRFGSVLVKMGVYNQRQLTAKSQVLKQNYINSVLKEVDALILIVNKKIFPQAFRELKNYPLNSTSKSLLDRKKKFEDSIENLSMLMEKIENQYSKINRQSAKEAQELRKLVIQANKCANNVVKYLPEDSEWPELFRVMRTL